MSYSDGSEYGVEYGDSPKEEDSSKKRNWSRITVLIIILEVVILIFGNWQSENFLLTVITATAGAMVSVGLFECCIAGYDPQHGRDQQRGSSIYPKYG